MKAIWIVLLAGGLAGCNGHSFIRPSSDTGFPVHEAIRQLRGELGKAEQECKNAESQPQGSVVLPDGTVSYKCDSGLGLTEADMTFELNATLEEKAEASGGISKIWSLDVTGDQTHGNKNTLTLKFALPKDPMVRDKEGKLDDAKTGLPVCTPGDNVPCMDIGPRLFDLVKKKKLLDTKIKLMNVPSDGK